MFANLAKQKPSVLEPEIRTASAALTRYRQRRKPKAAQPASCLPPQDGVPAVSAASRAWALLGVVEAERMPEVQRFRERHLPDGLKASAAEVKTWVRDQSHSSPKVDEYSGLKVGSKTMSRSHRGRSLYFDGFIWPVAGVPMYELCCLVQELKARLLWSEHDAVAFVLAGIYPVTLEQSWRLSYGSGLPSIQLTVPLCATAQEVATIYRAVQRRAGIRRAVIGLAALRRLQFAVPRLLDGASWEDIARAWAKREHTPGKTVRSTYYRAIASLRRAVAAPWRKPTG